MVTHLVIIAILAVVVAFFLSHDKITFIFVEKDAVLNQESQILSEVPNEISSSVFCSFSKLGNQECRFQNLCYYNNQYTYYYGKNSKEVGLQSDSPFLLDLSSVRNHTAKYFQFSNRTMTESMKFHYIRGNTILFHRFNPDNLMHVIHDDLLPYFHTRRKYFYGKEVTAIFMEGREDGPFYDLYTLFMERILTERNLTSMTCFENVIIGVSQEVTWYQYGFHTPQGPINVENYPTNELLSFKDEFMKRLKINIDQSLTISKVVIFKRQDTRRITNMNELVLKLSMRFKAEVTILDLQEDTFEDILTAISNAKLLIGVHGAHLVTSLFLPPGALLMEIYPYGIPSENYTPYKTLVSLIGVQYLAFETESEDLSTYFIDRPPNQGGIAHLPPHQKEEILNTKRVPKHLCCDNPFWLFRIYQDTEVDINRLLLLLRGKIS